MFFKRITLAILVVVGLYSVNTVFAQTMTSGTYRIQSDSVNFGGGYSTSTSYSLESTAGEIATGESSSSLFKIKAGYQQMQETIISVTAAADVTMSPAIGGITGGTSNGSTNFTVTTDNPAGYTVTIKASSSPALQSDLDTITDYSATVASPDYEFSIDPTESAFAFSAEGTDIVESFKDNGSACGVGSGDTSSACWAGLSTSEQIIVSRTSANHTAGTLTTIRFRAESGSSHVQTAGTYVATTTITVLPL
jgi:hypothetical protein